MKISKFGGVIAAANEGIAQPLLQVGNISIIRRIVISYQQAGVFPIVVITDENRDEVIRQLSGFGVIFLNNQSGVSTELTQAVVTGLRYLYGKCDRIVFTPVNVPMFTPDTLQQLLKQEGDVITPVYHGKGGHPIVLDNRIVPQILEYRGGGGLREAVDVCGLQRVRLIVEDTVRLCAPSIRVQRSMQSISAKLLHIRIVSRFFWQRMYRTISMAILKRTGML